MTTHWALQVFHELPNLRVVLRTPNTFSYFYYELFGNHITGLKILTIPSNLTCLFIFIWPINKIFYYYFISIVLVFLTYPVSLIWITCSALASKGQGTYTDSPLRKTGLLLPNEGGIHAGKAQTRHTWSLKSSYLANTKFTSSVLLGKHLKEEAMISHSSNLVTESPE